MSSTVTTPTVQRGAAQTCPECLSSGLVLSGIVYGIVATLFFDCLRLLIQKKTSLSCRRRLLFITYISMMFLASTAAVVLGSISVIRWPPGVGKIFSQHVFGPYVFALWGADGMMIWRCLVLYADTRRIFFRMLQFVLGALALASLACGVLYFILPLRMANTDSRVPIFLVALPELTTLTNTILASLVAFRLLWHQRRTRRVLGETYGTPYTRIVNICMESCLLIVLFNIALTVLFLKESGPATVIVELLITHVSVLSPLFVFHRVAQGTDAVTSIQTQDIRFQIEKPTDSANETNHRISTLRFTTSGGTESTA
ncbi:unnamed protein product [Cyclocybe aegerita]|uniref:Uncharacterized protein n=1 Tax=Cyclocybe aegerita TaxID=1973307 RepID=A0A8S0WSQ6_CYCAE|nr:unnamed protein product [Cyclocybe aegerita]